MTSANDIFSSNPSEITGALAGKNIFIAGGGGLGSNVAMLLVRAGADTLTVADFDTVEAHNLNRQFFFSDQIGQQKVDALKDNLIRINSALNIKTHSVKLCPENMSSLIPINANIIFECFDNPQSKADIVRFCLTERSNIPLIAVSGLAGAGSLDSIKTKKVRNNFYMIGDGKSDISDELGTLSSRVMFSASIQAHLGIRILSNLEVQEVR